MIKRFGTLYEKCLKGWLSEFLKTVINNYRFGFQKGKSTSNALFEVGKQFTNNLEKTKKLLLFSLDDLAKALDTDNHEEFVVLCCKSFVIILKKENESKLTIL